MNIEKVAVNEINQLLESCDHLEPLIDANDRTPLTDGHIPSTQMRRIIIRKRTFWVESMYRLKEKLSRILRDFRPIR